MNRPSPAFLAALTLAALSSGAAAQTPHPDSPVFKDQKQATCAECGVVRSVKRVETPQRITAEERKSTAGFVAQIPLGADKAVVGSSADTRDELMPPVVTYEVVVRLDDGRFQVVRQDDAANLREGDQVRIERGKVLPREK